MIKIEELKKCPFCHAQAEFIKLQSLWQIHCINPDCNARVSAVKKRKAFSKWQRRGQ